jgi:hypothetical protein
MLYYVAASSSNLADALKRLSRYARLGNEALVVRSRQQPACSVELSYSGVQRHQDRHQMELLAFTCLRLCRKLVGRNFSPTSVKFIHHRPGDIGQIRRLFGCAVEFDCDTDEISFDIDVMGLPLVAADPFLNELMTKMCDDALAVRSGNVSPFELSWKTLSHPYCRTPKRPQGLWQKGWVLVSERLHGGWRLKV